MIRFLLNPSSGGGRGAKAAGAFQDLAEAAGAAMEVSESAADLTSRTHRAVAEGVERLVVAGGDGTFHHAIQALAGTDCILGVVPLGRGNDLAASLGVPGALAPAVAWALEAPPREIDLGRVGGRYFVGYCGVGFDSEAAIYVNDPARLLGGSVVYVQAVLHTLIHFEPPGFRVTHEEGGLEGRAMFAVVSNHPLFGGGMRIAPGAVIDDGLLDLVFVREVSRGKLLRIFPKVYKGKHVGYPEVEIVRTRKATIDVDREMTMYGDGEPLLTVGNGPVEVEIRPRCLRVAAASG